MVDVKQPMLAQTVVLLMCDMCCGEFSSYFKKTISCTVNSRYMYIVIPLNFYWKYSNTILVNTVQS